jgi:hypothetical protein
VTALRGVPLLDRYVGREVASSAAAGFLVVLAMLARGQRTAAA